TSLYGVRALRRTFLDSIAWRADTFASAAGAATWSRELRPFTEYEVTVRTHGRLQNEAPAPIPCDRLKNVR
ncbi:MAG TPA: hypothetical protein VFP04_05665, partial [Nitrospira sp.]|nr:hypothetical protein [Nitrospira sp.]